MRLPLTTTVLVLAAAAAPRMAPAQAAVTSDLWRVAEGTLVVPAALAEDGSAALWTPAATLADDASAVRIGVEAVHAPSDVGLSGGVATLAIRIARLGTLNAVYGRMGVDGLVRTETSPESMGDIPVYAEVISLGLARRLTPALVAGVAVRSATGQLDIESQTQVGMDVGVRYTTPTRLTFAFATRFFSPALGKAEGAATYNFAACYESAPAPLWGASGTVAVRYGATVSHGEGVQHLFSAGVALGGVMEMDLGTSREVASGTAVWRSRFGLALMAGRYRIYLGRDGGVNGFGATYRFGLAAGLR